ncbi:MAG: hypothetical protein ACT4P4_08185 [Betaproteobacteria bacterium]
MDRIFDGEPSSWIALDNIGVEFAGVPGPAPWTLLLPGPGTAFRPGAPPVGLSGRAAALG